MVPIRSRRRRWLAASVAAIGLLASWGCTAPRQAPAADATAVQAGAVPEGINDRFVDPELDVDRWLTNFETESREIFSERHEIVERMKLREGMAIADIGAGTGLFLELFASAVGPQGKVYAVDISPKLVDFMAERAREAGWSQVETVLCSERSADLPDGSVDLVFMSDTYHHFEYHEDTMASLHRALRPRGHLFVVDFEKIPGRSREWVLGHVRADKQQVIAEIEAAGFRFEKELDVPRLRENYMLRFRKR